jgi:neutral amino acid transport system permease protein
MPIERLLRSPRVLLALVALGLLWPANQASAQDDAQEAATPAACTFSKRDAIDANGGPLGAAIWGRLCQLDEGKPTFAEGVEITVSLDGEEVGSATTEADGVFIIEIPGNGTYQVALDPDTLPDGFSLTNEDRATLGNLRVNLGDNQAIFRFGEDGRGQRSFADYATTVAKGLRLGLIIAVAAVGLSLVYGVTGLINFAHAELVTAGALLTFALTRNGIPFWLAVPIAMAGGAALGWSNDRFLWRPLRRRNMALLSMMVVSIGLSIAARNIFAIWFGPNSRRYAEAAGQTAREYGPFRLTPHDLIIMAICATVLLAMTVLLRKTRLGTAIRATADNPDLAASSGISVDRIISVVWMICGGLAALGGTLYGLSVNLRFDMGFVLLLSMFAAVVLGGLGNAYGAVLGAIVIGVVQETSGLFVDTAYKFVVALLVLILVLLIRPQGILGQRERFG